MSQLKDLPQYKPPPYSKPPPTPMPSGGVRRVDVPIYSSAQHERGVWIAFGLGVLATSVVAGMILFVVH